jgi:[ribosomal protein S5]-alanine N-acetyltransferase
LRIDDFEWLHPIASNADVTRYTPWGPMDEEQTRAFLYRAIHHGCGPDLYLWAVTLADGNGIGTANLEVTSTENLRAEFGYYVAPELWGNGYATEAAHAVVDFAFNTIGIHRLEAACHTDNRASARVMEKAGLTFEGRLRHHVRKDGLWWDSLLYAAIAPD